jgi:O-antigen/teichoic acid export membrane protein
VFWIDRPALTGFNALMLYGLSMLMVTAIALGLMARTWGGRGVAQEDGQRLDRAWLTAGAAIALVASLGALSSNLDVMMLGALASEKDAGLYRAATRGADFVAFGLAIFGPIFVPRAARAWRAGDVQALGRLAAAMASGAFMIALPIGLALLIFPRQALSIFGPEFVDMSTAMRVLVIGQLFNAFCSPVTALLMMAERERLVLVASTIALTLTGLLNYLLIPRFGCNGAAVASALNMIGLNLVLVLVVRRSLGIDCSALAGLALWRARLLRRS